MGSGNNSFVINRGSTNTRQLQANQTFFPPFKPTEDRSEAGKIIFYSITKMETNRNHSFEECRWYYNLATQNKLTENPFQETTNNLLNANCRV